MYMENCLHLHYIFFMEIASSYWDATLTKFPFLHYVLYAPLFWERDIFWIVVKRAIFLKHNPEEIY